GLLLGALTAGVSLALGVPLLRGEPGPALGAGTIAAVAAGSIVGAALCAMLGVAAGALGRRPGVGGGAALGLVFVATPLLLAVSATAAAVTPFGAAVRLAGDPSAHRLSWAGAGLVLAAWTAAWLVAAVLVERRRDLA